MNVTSETSRRMLARSLKLRTVGGFVMLFGLVSGGSAAYGVSPSAAARSCTAASDGINVHYLLKDVVAQGSVIAGISLSGFSRVCDGKSVAVTLAGNSAGDSAAPAIDLLSTLDSRLDPCTGENAGDPAVVTDASITIHGCASTDNPQRGAYASIQNVTRLTVKWNGQDIRLQGSGTESGNESGGADNGGDSGNRSEEVSGGLGVNTGSDGSGVQNAVSSGLLPFTGGPGAMTFWLGVLLVLTGLVTVRDSKRRA